MLPSERLLCHHLECSLPVGLMLAVLLLTAAAWLCHQMVVKSIETEDIDTEHGVPFQIFYVRHFCDFSTRCNHPAVPAAGAGAAACGGGAAVAGASASAPGPALLLLLLPSYSCCCSCR